MKTIHRERPTLTFTGFVKTAAPFAAVLIVIAIAYVLLAF